MNVEVLMDALDTLGIVVFAMSGALAAGRKNMDLFGVAVLGVVTAVGGGTFRDIALGLTPVFWVGHPIYLYEAIIASIFVVLVARKIRISSRWLDFLDAIGLAAFAVLGTEVALSQSVSPSIAVFFGVISGCFGGMVRDVLAGEVPYILRHEVYATACLAGCVFYVTARQYDFNSELSMLLAVAIIFGLRVWAILAKLSLPKAKLY